MSQSPKWIYKILPHSSVDTRYTFPIPIPASHSFFLSELDYKDGFVHLSTAAQVPRTLERFFSDVPAVTLLRLETARISAFKRVRWEESHGEKFPHLYALLEGENIDSFKEVHRTLAKSGEKLDGQGLAGWGEALKSVDGWLE
ncbi:hypothetical protein BCR39DRAFT_556696 [Naematelia encephala]|uniref:DUF952 domain-containing protein n=1 Tax=Naematelia encephala TaxID=71784 RepID=A0A1Y2BHN1_9TREE|nr:hypothetical protein BCR39DRAFT_556696 [Naematelia encephala]